MGIESPFDLLGLYSGVDLARKRHGRDALRHGFPLPPDPRLLGRAEGTLGHIITHVLVHEIGHYFGLSDADSTSSQAAV